MNVWFLTTSSTSRGSKSLGLYFLLALMMTSYSIGTPIGSDLTPYRLVTNLIWDVIQERISDSYNVHQGDLLTRRIRVCQDNTHGCIWRKRERRRNIKSKKVLCCGSCQHFLFAKDYWISECLYSACPSHRCLSNTVKKIPITLPTKLPHCHPEPIVFRDLGVRHSTPE